MTKNTKSEKPTENKEVKEDFLNEDAPVRGQEFGLISFVSPEDVLNNKQVYFVHRFLQTVGKNYGLTVEECQNKYKDFMFVNEEKLEEEFHEKNEFRTTIRGLKLRGNYPTLKEAQEAAKRLRMKDPSFDIFCAPVGFWIPWSPNPMKVETQEYQEAKLNELVSEYKKNQEKKDIHFHENIEYVKEQAAKQKEKAQQEIEEGKTTALLPDVNPLSIGSEEDPWMKRHTASTEPVSTNDNVAQEDKPVNIE